MGVLTATFLSPFLQDKVFQEFYADTSLALADFGRILACVPGGYPVEHLPLRRLKVVRRMESRTKNLLHSRAIFARPCVCELLFFVRISL